MSQDTAQTTRRYRPSNGTEGIGFMERWCDRCRRDAAFQAGEGDSCPIAAATMVFAVTDADYPAEWTYAADGSPCCTAFEPLDGAGPVHDRRQEALAL